MKNSKENVFSKEQNQLVNIYVCIRKICYAFSRISYIVYAFSKTPFIFAFSNNIFFCIHPYFKKESKKNHEFINVFSHKKMHLDIHYICIAKKIMHS